MTILQIIKDFAETNKKLCDLTPMVSIDKVKETFGSYGEKKFNPPRLVLYFSTNEIGKKLHYNSVHYENYINRNELIDEFEYDKQESYIRIERPVIFDQRLIPNKFKGLKVEYAIWGDYPKEYFPKTEDNLPYYEVFTPENYKKFAENNIDLIRSELKNRGLSISEALDALTGNFEDYKRECHMEKRYREIDHKNKTQLNHFEKELLVKYEDIKEYSGVPNWSYEKISPAIPFVGNNYQKVKRRVLIYGSAENLTYVYGKEDEKKAYKDFLRNRKYFKEGEFFNEIHIQPISDGSLLTASRYILSMLGYDSDFSNNPKDFLEEIAASNFSKFSINSPNNIDPIKLKYLKHSIPYIITDIKTLEPEIIILPNFGLYY